MIKIDFHTHSTSSDGLMSPKGVVERAYQNGVKYLALTDHDTVSGLHNAIQTAKEINLYSYLVLNFLQLITKKAYIYLDSLRLKAIWMMNLLITYRL